MAAKHVELSVEKYILEIIQGSQLELVDVEYVKERDWYLRIFLDKIGGIEIEDCQWVSERLEERLDQYDLISESYILEVSSPGLDRPLKKEKDFTRHVGDRIEIHTFVPVQGTKTLVGTLVGLVNDEINIAIEGIETKIPRAKTSLVRLHVDF